ncbi:hypothetical protein ES703_74184 [subsurface metagenome]
MFGSEVFVHDFSIDVIDPNLVGIYNSDVRIFVKCACHYLESIFCVPVISVCVCDVFSSSLSDGTVPGFVDGFPLFGS